MDKSVKISAEQYKTITQIAKREGRKIKAVLQQAIRNFFIAKKIMEE